jgi:hypothetical protein
MLDRFGEAFAGIFALIVVPALLVVVPVGLVCAGIVYVLRRASPSTTSLIARLRWRLPLFLYSSSFAIASYFGMRSFSDTYMGILLAVGPGLVMTVTAPIAVVSAVLIIAKILADRVEIP